MKKTICIFAICIMCVFTGCKSKDYDAAMKLYESGDFTAAQEAFEALEDYKDSEDLAKDCKYQNALTAVDEMNYEDAITLFTELGDYKESASYLENTESKIDGVSDKAYYFGMRLLDQFTDSDYQKQLQEDVKAIEQNDIEGDWTKVPGGDLSKMIAGAEPVRTELERIQKIAGDGAKDKEFVDAIINFYCLVLDNAWGHALEGTECSSMFASSGKILAYLSDDASSMLNIMETAQALDSFIPMVYDDLRERQDLNDIGYIDTLANIAICHGLD